MCSPQDSEVCSVCSSAGPHVENSVWFCSNTSKGHNPIAKESLGLTAVVLIQTSLRTYTLGPKLLECYYNCFWRPLSTFCWCWCEIWNQSLQKWDGTWLFHYINLLPSHCFNRLWAVSSVLDQGPSTPHEETQASLDNKTSRRFFEELKMPGCKMRMDWFGSHPAAIWSRK